MKHCYANARPTGEHEVHIEVYQGLRSYLPGTVPVVPRRSSQGATHLRIGGWLPHLLRECHSL